MDLDPLAEDLRRRFDEKTAARERVLPATRRSIRASANAIRAIHRSESETAGRLMAEAEAALGEASDACRDHHDLRHAGYLQDAQKEYAEARITAALVGGDLPPGTEELGVEIAPYVNGMAEAIGEGRRRMLDLLRGSDVEAAEAVLSAMEDLFHVLVTMDYPDAITGNLRRSTDVARRLIEKTRGDLSVAIVARDLRSALDRHARSLRKNQA